MAAQARRSLLAAAFVLLTACGAADATSGDAASSSGAAGAITVFAAASLTDAFTEIGEATEAANPGVRITFNFAGSQQLATQILEGAPADVFASADPTQLSVVEDAGGVAGDPTVFARNQLAIAVEPGNPAGITSLRDLARDDVTVVLAAEQVPAGRYAADALAGADVSVSPVSLETDVRAVLAKVALGEADAGIVYASDVATADDRVASVAVPDKANVTATYPIAVLDAAPNAAGARLFVDAVQSEAGQATLRRHGFTTR